MICIPIIASNQQDAIANIKDAENLADIIELRIDYLKGEFEIKELLNATEKPCIVTCRPAREGGGYTKKEEKRIAILQDAAKKGAEYIDIELDDIDNYQRVSDEKIICSFHDFDSTPSDLNLIVKRIEDTNCDIVKFATMANRLEDNLKVWEAMAQCRKPVVGLCMGELGEVSRILAIRQGGFLTFGSLRIGEESAPGQITAHDMVHLYNVNKITSKTRLYCVVGNPIAHSVSPEIHNSAFRHLGLDCVYLKFRVDNLALFLKKFESLSIQGLSVTIPHKHTALDLSDSVEPIAKRIGAVNTLTRKGEKWHGDNTDCMGALSAIKKGMEKIGISINGSTALLIGAGGAARGICYGLKEAGAEVVIVNRTHGKAEQLAQETSTTALEIDKITNRRFDIIANSTSVGMHPNCDVSPVPTKMLHDKMVAFDAIYNPRQTKFLKEAKDAGAEIVDGVEMFVGQAVRQFEIWQEGKAPAKVMENIVIKRLSN